MATTDAFERLLLGAQRLAKRIDTAPCCCCLNPKRSCCAAMKESATLLIRSLTLAVSHPCPTASRVPAASRVPPAASRLHLRQCTTENSKGFRFGGQLLNRAPLILQKNNVNRNRSATCLHRSTFKVISWIRIFNAKPAPQYISCTFKNDMRPKVGELPADSLGAFLSQNGYGHDY